MSRPAKRQRTENASITRSDIWYEDGSVVLAAENTQFRVHWSILAQSSPFFRGIQGLPQPPNQPSVDSCPVVELPDAVADVENLLRALYIPSFLHKKTLPLSVIGSLIRLGRKYDFKDLFVLAVERLTYENPTTIEEYEALSTPDGAYEQTRIVPYAGVFFDIVTLARENSILSVLPCAYYRVLMMYNRAQLFDGVPRGDGTTASLAPVDQRRYVLGREKILKKQFQPGYTLGWLRTWEYYDDCIDPQHCPEIRQAEFCDALDTVKLRALAKNPGKIMSKLCALCKQRAIGIRIAGRAKLWEDLPSFFDLPPWNELKNDL
ncbi:hypothetical protein DFH09DRAFT_908809 [Mycena vulgaris]|nr:hypothetical protein DFH09DRAFT_908809 [Mycena vulgaris]